MRGTVALLATVFLFAGLAGCGEDGAEPGAPQGAVLVLDFNPNAVHAGIYAALDNGFYRDAGVDLEVQRPGESTDAPKLLAAGRADFAILDINDLGVARERSFDLVGLMSIVNRPLASVFAHYRSGVARPRDLEGHTVGVTGLPSDEAVVDSEVSADGGDPAKVKRVTIGFNAVASLIARKVDAVTGFWNAEGVVLERKKVPIRTFIVNEFGAPPYPELILTASRQTLEEEPDLVDAVVAATKRGYKLTQLNPTSALNDLLEADPALDRYEQQEQLAVVSPYLRPTAFFPSFLHEWAEWALEHGILERPLDVEEAFDLKG